MQLGAAIGGMLFLGALAAGGGTVLEDAVQNWLGERDHWAFTQRAVEYKNGQPRERLERYDPSQPGNARWKLLAIDGRAPTGPERSAWEKKKFRPNRRRFDMPISGFFDFGRAKVVEENAGLVRYEVPLSFDKNWLFQVDRVRVYVTVNRQTGALEHLTADVQEPVKVLLGLAKITDGAVDLNFLPFNGEASPGPEGSQPVGHVHVAVSKFGERVEFTWSEFKRVVSPAD